MSPDVDPQKSSKRDRSFFEGFSPRKWLVGAGSFLRAGFYLAVVGLVIYLGYDFYSFVRSAPELAANVTVEGNSVVAVSQIESVVFADTFSGSGDSTTIFALSPDAVEGRLRSQLDRLKSVKVWKLPPRELKIKVEEREPIALVATREGKNGDRRFKPADREGVVFKIQPGERERLLNNHPPVLGLEDFAPGSSEFRRLWRRFLEARQAFEEVFNARTVEFYKFQPGGGLLVRLVRPRKLDVHLGRGDYQKKVEKLYEIMATEEFHQIEEYVDLSNPEDIRVQ